MIERVGRGSEFAPHEMAAKKRGPRPMYSVSKVLSTASIASLISVFKLQYMNIIVIALYDEVQYIHTDGSIYSIYASNHLAQKPTLKTLIYLLTVS